MALTDDHLSTSAVWEALVVSSKDSDVDGALSLIGREPSPTLVGPATVCLAIRIAGEEEYGDPTDRAKRALPLATRLVEQHAAAVLTPRLLELIKADTKDYVWHKAVSDPAFVSIVGAIAAALRQPVLDTRDSDGRKAYDTACKECRLAMDEATIFCGRFKLGEQLHRSATCVVYLALDVRNDGALVVVKLMLNRDQYEREVRWGSCIKFYR